MNTPTNPGRTDLYLSPQLVDGGEVETLTQDDIEGSRPEECENIIWGQDDVDPDTAIG
jgi:hypothetical protein